MKMGKKILSMMVAVMMLCALLPTSAVFASDAATFNSIMAQGATVYESFENGLGTWRSEGSATLVQDFSQAAAGMASAKLTKGATSYNPNVLPENAFVDVDEERKLFASNQAAMYIIHPTERMLVKNYSMDKDNICFARVPAGPAGRYTLMGGNFYAVSPESTPEQIDALFKFLEIKSHSPKVTDKIKETSGLSMKKDNEENVPVMRKPAFPIWINNERAEFDDQLRAQYANVPEENFADYSSFIDVMVREEEPVCAQELYSIFDAGIQQVLTEKDADCAAIVKEMANDFQKNHLDKLD